MLFFLKKKYLFFSLFVLMTSFSFLGAKKPSVQSHLRSSRPLVVLDAGHGGFNVGARGHKPYCEEKKLALSTARMVKQYLEDLGYRVVMTRSSDFFVPLDRRVFIANHSHAEIFVSIHFNSCPSKEVHGIEVYYTDSQDNRCRSSDSKKLAHAILNKTVSRTGAISRGVRSAHFVVIRETNVPAILIEGGYITNLGERRLLRSREHLDKIAHGIAEGVHHYFRSS